MMDLFVEGIVIAGMVLLNSLPPALILGGSVMVFDPDAAVYTFTAVFVWKAVATMEAVLSYYGSERG